VVSDRAAAKAVVKERRKMRRLGFEGRAGKVLSHTKDKASHHMRIVEYHFPNDYIRGSVRNTSWSEARSDYSVQ
jgi:hypothetical protein